jgi:hypothetical protein
LLIPLLRRLAAGAISTLALAGPGCTEQGGGQLEPSVDHPGARHARPAVSTQDAANGVVRIISVEGNAFVARAQAPRRWHPLRAGDEIRSGDRIRTGVHGAVTIAGPGKITTRLTENTEFVIGTERQNWAGRRQRIERPGEESPRAVSAPAPAATEQAPESAPEAD